MKLLQDMVEERRHSRDTNTGVSVPQTPSLGPLVSVFLSVSALAH